MNESAAIILLLVAALVAIVAQKVRLPYSVGLVVAGIVLSMVPFAPQVNLTRELLFGTLLPPLIFEAAFSLSWSALKRNLGVILTLATLGVVISATITAVGMRAAVGWPWASAVMFGILIAATDPVSVIAAFREAKVAGRLRLLVEAESLFNDGTAAVAFSILLAFSLHNNVSPGAIAWSAIGTIGGGLLCGALVGCIVLAFVGRTQDHLVELTFTTVAAYGSFLLADNFGASGVLATLTAGLVVGNFGEMGQLTARGREAVVAFWDFAAFLANSLVFLLIGMHEAHQPFRGAWAAGLAAILFVSLGRAGAVYPTCLIFERTAQRVPRAHQHVLFWGGLRGGLALALALALPEELPLRTDIIKLSFAVVAFSVFVQGLTMTPFLRAMGELPHADDQAHTAKSSTAK